MANDVFIVTVQSGVATAALAATITLILNAGRDITMIEKETAGDTWTITDQRPTHSLSQVSFNSTKHGGA